MYFSPSSTSWYRRFGTGCIARNGEWRKFELFRIRMTFFWNFSVLFVKGILRTPVQKAAVPSMIISNYYRWKPNSTKINLCMGLSLFNIRLTKVVWTFVSTQYQRQMSIKLLNPTDLVRNIAKGIRSCVKIKTMDLANMQRKVTFAAAHITLTAICLLSKAAV